MGEGSKICWSRRFDWYADDANTERRRQIVAEIQQSISGQRLEWTRDAVYHWMLDQAASYDPSFGVNLEILREAEGTAEAVMRS